MKTRFTLLTSFLAILTLSAISQKEGDWSIMDTLNAPEARHGHSMVTLPDGGIGEDGPLNDMWIYNVIESEWTQQSLTGVRPCARYGQTNTRIRDGSILILGGTDSTGAKLNDFWKMNTDYSFERLPDTSFWRCYRWGSFGCNLVINKQFAVGGNNP